MAKEWKKKGLVVVGVSDEDFDLIDGYVEKHGVEFPIARLASGEFEAAIGVDGFPTSAILSPKGELAWKGHPAEADSAISSNIKGSKNTPLLPKELSGVEKSLDKDNFPAAFKELNELMAKGQLADESKVAAEALLKFINASANRLWTKGSAALEEGDYYTASLAFQALAADYEGIGSAAEASAKLAEFKADKAIGNEIKGGEKLVSITELIEEGDYDKAYKSYLSLASKFKDTRTGERAAAKADELKTGGMLGYDKNCQACQGGRKACERHAK